MPILALTELGKKDASWLDLPRICVANTRYQGLRLAFVDLSRYGNCNLFKGHRDHEPATSLAILRASNGTFLPAISL